MGSSMWLIIWAYSFWKLLDTLMRKYKNIHWDNCVIWYNLQGKERQYSEVRFTINSSYYLAKPRVFFLCTEEFLDVQLYVNVPTSNILFYQIWKCPVSSRYIVKLCSKVAGIKVVDLALLYRVRDTQKAERIWRDSTHPVFRVPAAALRKEALFGLL